MFCPLAAVATNTRNGRSSVPEPLLLLYNRVADNRPQDWDPCVRATALGNHTVRIFADHGYGSVDIGVVAFPRWLRFEVLSLTMWHADPVSVHAALKNPELVVTPFLVLPSSSKILASLFITWSW